MEYREGTGVSSPAASTMLEVLAPYLKDDVMVLEGISVPGTPFNLWADLLLVGEYETVAVVLGENESAPMEKWTPRYPLGLVTDVFTLPATELFYHLDDVAYMITSANPSLFIASAAIEFSSVASRTVRKVAGSASGTVVPLVYPLKDRVDLDIHRYSTVHTPHQQPLREVQAA